MSPQLKLSTCPTHIIQKITYRGVTQKSHQRLVWRGVIGPHLVLEFFFQPEGNVHMNLRRQCDQQECSFDDLILILFIYSNFDDSILIMLIYSNFVDLIQIMIIYSTFILILMI